MYLLAALPWRCAYRRRGLPPAATPYHLRVHHPTSLACADTQDSHPSLSLRQHPASKSGFEYCRQPGPRHMFANLNHPDEQSKRRRRTSCARALSSVGRLLARPTTASMPKAPIYLRLRHQMHLSLLLLPLLSLFASIQLLPTLSAVSPSLLPTSPSWLIAP